MPAAIPAVIGLVAGAYAASALTGAVILGITISSFAAGLFGAVIASGVTMLAGAVLGGPLGLNKRPRQDLSSLAQDRKQSIRQPTAPRQIVYGTARVGGTMTYVFSFGPDLRYLGIVTVLATHPIAGVDGVWINDSMIPAAWIGPDGMVTEGTYVGRCRIRIHDGRQTEADPLLVAESPDGWDAAHIGHGCAYLYIRLEFADGVFGGGLQNIGATIRGKSDILDPRTGLTGWTDNWALCVLDYMRSPLGVRCAADAIDLGSFVAAANLSDEAVVIDAAGTTQPRYRADGVLSMAETRRANLARLLTAGAGSLVYIQGRYRLIGGAYTSPTDTLTVGELAGEVTVVRKPPMREVFNGVKGTFIDPGRYWQAAEFPAVLGAAFEAEDGERLWRDLELPFTIDPLRAQRLARMELLRGREALTIDAPVQFRGIRYAAMQMLSVTIPGLGLAAKPMRIESLKFRAPQGGSGEAGPIIVLRLREESAAAYAWSWADATIPPSPPDTTLASPLDLPAPAGLAIGEELYATRDGSGIRTRAVPSWAPIGSPFVTAYEVQWRVAGGEWRQAPGTLGETRAAVDDLADGLHEFRVRARSLLGTGAWATVTARIGTLAAAPPTAITGLSIQTIGGLAWLRWDRHPDIDVRIGGRIEVRHTPDDVAPSWIGSTGIGQAVPGDASFHVLPLKPGAYLLKAVDAGGRQAEAAAIIRTSQASMLDFAAVQTLTEHATFPGAKTDTVVSAGTLRLDSGGLVSGVALFSAIPRLAALGGVKPTGSYVFSGGMDLTTVRGVRLTGKLRATAVDVLTTIASRPDPVSTWSSFVGAVGGEADAWIEMRETPDDPAGTPTWSAWRRLDAMEARNRGFQFRAQLRSYDPAVNVHVTELSVAAEEVT